MENRKLITSVTLIGMLTVMGFEASNHFRLTETSNFNSINKSIKNLVPDEETAKKIAEAIWIPIYGKTTIDEEKPFVATLSKGVWIVSGTLPKGYKGGTAYIEINQKNCEILKVLHYK